MNIYIYIFWYIIIIFILLNNVNRKDENNFLFRVSKKLKCQYTVYNCSDEKSFGVIDNR